MVRRTALRAAAGLVALVVAGAVWVAVTGLLARHDAEQVGSDIARLKHYLASGDERSALALEHSMQSQAAAAHGRTTGPAWWMAAKVPRIGAPLATARKAAVLLDRFASQALPAAVAAGVALDPGRLRIGPGTIDLNQLSRAAAPLDTAARGTTGIAAQARALPASSWLGIVDTARDAFVEQVTGLQYGFEDLATAVRLLPDPLGASGVRRYFVGFETDAEARGLGGLPGAYAILRADHGRLRFERFGSDVDLAHAHARVHLGAAYDAEFSQLFAPEAYFGNSDPSPHFPDAARIWMSMWQRTYHQRLDGAIATDPTALGYLLAAVGPVRIGPATVVNKSNTVDIFESKIYQRFGTNTAVRKAYQVAAARKVGGAVIQRAGKDLLRTARALTLAVDERRLLVFTTDRTVESTLSQGPGGGILPRTSRPFLDVVVNNAGGNKLDYYLDRTVVYRRDNCAAGPATVTVTLRNSAPAHGLSPTVLGQRSLTTPGELGRTRLIVSLYGSAHSAVRSVTLDGTHAFFSAAHERGHPVTQTFVTIPPGESRTIVYSVHEPATAEPLLALRQPLVRPLRQTIIAPDCQAGTS